MLGLGLGGYHPDSHDDAAVAFGIQVVEGSSTSPFISTVRGS